MILFKAVTSTPDDIVCSLHFMKNHFCFHGVISCYHHSKENLRYERRLLSQDYPSENIYFCIGQKIVLLIEITRNKLKNMKICFDRTNRTG